MLLRWFFSILATLMTRFRRGCVAHQYPFLKGSSEFPMGENQTMLKNVVQVYFFLSLTIDI